MHFGKPDQQQHGQWTEDRLESQKRGAAAIQARMQALLEHVRKQDKKTGKEKGGEIYIYNRIEN